MKETATYRAALRDIRDINIDQSLPPAERIRRYIREVQNPYVLRVGDNTVRLGWADAEATLQQRVTELLGAQCR